MQGEHDILIRWGNLKEGGIFFLEPDTGALGSQKGPVKCSF